MAGCDFIRTDKYQDYLDLKEWAKQHKFTCPNGMVVNPIEYVFDLREDYFKEGHEISVMHSPCEMDYFLIKHCQLQFVRDYLKTVYNDTNDFIQSVLDGTSVYDRFVPPARGRNKVKIIYRNSRKNKLLNFRGRGSITHKQKFWVHDVNYNGVDLCYNDEYDRWVMGYDEKTDTCELGEVFSSATDCSHSIKALIRKIKKWKLPKGTILEASGRCDHEEYKFVVK